MNHDTNHDFQGSYNFKKYTYPGLLNLPIRILQELYTFGFLSSLLQKKGCVILLSLFYFLIKIEGFYHSINYFSSNLQIVQNKCAYKLVWLGDQLCSKENTLPHPLTLACVHAHAPEQGVSLSISVWHIHAYMAHRWPTCICFNRTIDAGWKG